MEILETVDNIMSLQTVQKIVIYLAGLAHSREEGVFPTRLRLRPIEILSTYHERTTGNQSVKRRRVENDETHRRYHYRQVTMIFGLS